GRDHAAPPHQRSETVGARPELQAAGTGVGTGRVDLERGDDRQIGEAGDHPRVVVERGARDVHEHAGAPQRRRQHGNLVRPPAGATTASLRSNSSRYATIPSAMALASLCWPRLEARNAPSVRFVAKPVSTKIAGRRAVVSTMKAACCTP